MGLLVTKSTNCGNRNRTGKVIRGHRSGKTNIFQVGAFHSVINTLHHRWETGLLRNSIRNSSREIG